MLASLLAWSITLFSSPLMSAINHPQCWIYIVGRLNGSLNVSNNLKFTTLVIISAQ